MLENRIPLFEKGRVLKKETLEQLRDYPVDLTRLFLAEYSDGIINGFSISFRDGMLQVGPGLLKHNGLLYWMREEEMMPLTDYGMDCRLYLVIELAVEAEDYYAHCFSLVLCRKEEVPKGECYELGRFHLKTGAVLRTGGDYLNFQDASTPVNTLGIHGRRYSGSSGATLSPQLTGLYGEEMISLDSRTSLDDAFCMACLSGRIVEQNAIAGYLSASRQALFKAVDTESLYHSLLELLRERKSRQGQTAVGDRRNRRTVIE